MQKLPLGNGSAERVVVKYPSEGGYAPGDTWELYVGADHRIEELIYHGGGPGTQKRPSARTCPHWANTEIATRKERTKLLRLHALNGLSDFIAVVSECTASQAKLAPVEQRISPWPQHHYAVIEGHASSC
jgi:hypothetical protein